LLLESRNNSITSNKSPTPTSSFASSKPGTPRASFTSAVRGTADIYSPMSTSSVQPRYAAVAAASTDSRTNTPIGKSEIITLFFIVILIQYKNLINIMFLLYSCYKSKCCSSI